MEQEMKQTIMIPTSDGKEREATCIGLIKVDEVNKFFLIYTFGEHDDNGMEVLHVSEFIDNGDNTIDLKEVEPNDWNIVKNYLREAIKSEEE